MLSQNAIIRVVDVRNRIFKSTAALINLPLVTVEHLPQIVVNYPFWSDKTWILIADNCRLVHSDIMIFAIWDAMHAILLSLASAFSWVQPPSRTACKNSNFQTNSWWLGGGGEVLKGMVRRESPGLVHAKFMNVLFLEMVAHGNTNPRSLQVSTKHFPREFYSGPLASTNQWFVQQCFIWSSGFQQPTVTPPMYHTLTMPWRETGGSLESSNLNWWEIPTKLIWCITNCDTMDVYAWYGAPYACVNIYITLCIWYIHTQYREGQGKIVWRSEKNRFGLMKLHHHHNSRYIYIYIQIQIYTFIGSTPIYANVTHTTFNTYV